MQVHDEILVEVQPQHLEPVSLSPSLVFVSTISSTLCLVNTSSSNTCSHAGLDPAGPTRAAVGTRWLAWSSLR